MDYKDATKLINETQAMGASNGWDMLQKLRYLIDRVESLTAKQAQSSGPFSEGLEGQDKEASCWNLSVGVWFESEISGLWYHNEKAAGEISAVKINGVLYKKAD